MAEGKAAPRTARMVPFLLRTAAAVLALGLFIFAYLSPDTASSRILGPLVHTQFSAALYGTGLAGITVLCIIALSLLTGRVFCSVLCPLGTLQEILWRAGNIFFKRRARKGLFRSGYAAKPKIRFIVPVLTGAGLVFAFTPLMILFDPISNFGRGMGVLISAGTAGAFAIGIALPLIVILIFAFFRGRLFCDWCPAGLSLGLFSSFALFRVRLSASACSSCGICEKKCPSGCINSKAKRIDVSRCVLCFSCQAACPGGAIAYGPGGRVRTSSVSGEARRSFLKGAVPLFCGAVYLFSPHIRNLLRLAGRPGGTAVAGDRVLILPPGAGNAAHYRARCVSCHACAAACPVKIIKVTGPPPNPVLDYTEASCQYNCVECGAVCPTGAIRRIDIDEKHRTRIALSSLLFENCVVKTRNEACGACAEVCPSRAVRMAAYPEPGFAYLTRPVFDEQYCIGCGACLVVCPAEPKAFKLTAVPAQSLTPGIRPSDEGQGGLYNPADDFPF
jgi:ferredoxin